MSTVRIGRVSVSMRLNSETILILGVIRSNFPWVPAKLSRRCNELVCKVSFDCIFLLTKTFSSTY